MTMFSSGVLSEICFILNCNARYWSIASQTPPTNYSYWSVMTPPTVTIECFLMKQKSRISFMVDRLEI